MFVVNKDASIYVTRGDSCIITVTAKEGEEDYTFKAGDILRIKVFEKKACHCVVIQKDFLIVEDTLVMDLGLTEEETRIGPVISKPVDYWYEIELNPGNSPQTIIGYDDDGPKIFKLFPEGQDVNPDDPGIQPEDIPVVDPELDFLSERPVQNKVITKELHRISARIDKAIEESREADQAHADNKENPHGVTKEQVGLDKVPNVATNDQTPTFAQAEQLENLVSGEKLSVSFGKIMRGLAYLISHLANKGNPHAVTASQVGLGNVNNTSDEDKPVSTAQAQAIAEAKNEAIGKADNAKTAADNAQTAADNAQDAADEAMAAAQEAMTRNPKSIELYPESDAGNGGFIDFHYNGSTEDYTSRVIESEEGELNVNGVRFKDGKVYAQSIESEAWNGDTIPVSMGGTGATDAETARANLNVRAIENSMGVEGQGSHDCDSKFDVGLTMVSNGANGPHRYSYGSLLTLPYRQAVGNTFQDYCGQIYIPNGDGGRGNALYYRTSLKEAWNPWKEVMTTVLGSHLYGDTLPSSGETGQIFFVKG